MFLNSLPFVVLLLVPSGAWSQPNLYAGTMLHPSGQRAVSREFTRGVDRYMNVRWMLEAPLGPHALCADPEEAQRTLSELANLIRSERATVLPGNIFTPAVAEFFRQQISGAFREDGYQLLFYLEDATTGIPVDLPAVEVNDTLPWAVGDRLWPSLMAKLPALPVELEYRIVGRDLVLVDVSIDLVVDVLEEVDRYW
jgi:hypothetical protein